MMKLFFAMLALTIGALIASQSHAQQEYDIWTDPDGRHFLVDPYTGELVKEVFRERPASRRELRRQKKRLRQREIRRERRRTRLQRELESLFGLERRRDDRRFRRRQFDDNDFEPPRRRDRNRRRAAPETDNEIASVPRQDNAIERRPLPAGVARPKLGRDQMAGLQIVLDRAGFSPGVIDGKWGSNMANAMRAYKDSTGKNPPATADALQQALENSGGAALYDYTLTEADIAGPFIAEVPVDYAKKARLETLAYTSVYEKIAERFHMSEAWLRELNEGKNFTRSGTRIRVAAPGTVKRNKVHYIVADKSREQVRAFDRNGKLVVAYPATIGSAETPSPSGTHSIERIAFDPNYTYNPKINFKQGDNDKILTIPPGPNGPVGSVWIALSKPTYGIHGTPDPDKIGKTNSNGCIRLTNWDAQELAKMVSKGVTVEFAD